MERWIKEYFDALFAAGLVYRYTPERYQQLLPMGGKPFASPARATVGLDGQEYLEEFIQPTVLPVSINENTAHELNMLARAWKQFFLAQNQITRAHPELLAATGTAAEHKRGLEGNGFPVPFVRLDMVRSGNSFKVVDINTTRPAGIGDWNIINRVTSDSLPSDVSRLCQYWFYEITLDKAVGQMEASWQEYTNNTLLGRKIVTVPDGDWHNFVEIARMLDAGLKIASDFQPKQNSTIIRGKIKEGDAGFDPLAALYPHHACVLSPLFKRWCGNKLWFVLPQQDPYKQEFIQAMGPNWNVGFWYNKWRDSLPATGIVKAGTIDFPGNQIPAEALSTDTRWLLKTPSGSSAKGIRLSWWGGSKQKWIKTLYNCPQGIVQECGGEPETVFVLNETGDVVEKKLNAKYGLFLLNGEIGGMEVMYSPRPIVHGGRDTYLTVVRRPWSQCPQDNW